MSCRQPLDRLRDSAPVILPSLLLCDFGNLEREIRRLEQAGVRALHLDVMDGHFVPNLTYGMPVVEACRRLTDLPLDVHLMIDNPGQYIAAFLDAGADIVTVHIEATGESTDLKPLLQQIHARGACAGVALNPDTPVAAVEPYLDSCDLVLVMSVNAGFGGQVFNPVALEKLTYLRSVAPEGLCLEVDGGVNAATISQCAQAGAELFVVGSAIFRQPEYGHALRQLRSAADRDLGR
jgi:ribulose-phosphate 3-epimerase